MAWGQTPVARDIRGSELKVSLEAPYAGKLHVRFDEGADVPYGGVSLYSTPQWCGLSGGVRCWGGVFGLIGGCLVAEEANIHRRRRREAVARVVRLLPGCARTLLGRNFVPDWELRRPCLGIFLSLLGNSGVAPRNFGLPSWSGVELPR